MESLARLVILILGTAISSGIIAIILWRRPPRNAIIREVFILLMLPVICIGVFLATLSAGVGVRVLGVIIFIAAVLAIRSMLSRSNSH